MASLDQSAKGGRMDVREGPVGWETRRGLEAKDDGLEIRK